MLLRATIRLDMQGEEMITGTEVEAIFKISKSTLWRWRKAGKIKYVKYGYNLYRYPKTEIDKITRVGIK